MKIQQTSKFKRQLRKLAKKHYPVATLKLCVRSIIKQDIKVLKQIKDHKLSGKWKDYREFHPSRVGNYSNKYDGWVVVYKVENNKLILTLVATGNHDILDRN